MDSSEAFASVFGGKDQDRGRLFVEFQAAEPPKTLNIFPVPGTYKHPRFGNIEVTPEGNRLFVDNFRAGVYQEHIPIDAEHETKLSGAIGWIKGLSINANGSVEATVDWTERGTTLIHGDRFRYVSPEWFGTWTDPASGKVHKNVLAGAALTTRPFFKEGALRPLVATERGLFDVDVREAYWGAVRRETPREDVFVYPRKAGDDVTRIQPLTATEAEATVHSEAHRLLRLHPDMDWNGAVAMACSENPELYRAYDTARMREADAEKVPHPEQPTVGTAGPEGADDLMAELRSGAEERGLTVEEFCSTPEGGRLYAAHSEAHLRPQARGRKS